MPPEASNGRTFSLQTPCDLYRKLRFEAISLRQAPPDDLTERAYAVMNAITTAWQMKDWVYVALSAAGRLDDLHRFAGREIRGVKDFGSFLTTKSPWMSMSFQIATAAKHFVMNANGGPEVITEIDFQVDPAAIGNEPAAVQEIIVRTRNNSISGPDLVMMMSFVWGRLLLDFGLVTADDLE